MKREATKIADVFGRYSSQNNVNTQITVQIYTTVFDCNSEAIAVVILSASKLLNASGLYLRIELCQEVDLQLIRLFQINAAG